MSKLTSLILRFGPLVAAAILGLSAVLPANVKPIADAIVSVLGLFGAAPNAEFLSNVGLAVSGVVALIGVARKLLALIKSA